MNTFGLITSVDVVALEIGDVFAYDAAGGRVGGGRIEAIGYAAYNLPDKLRLYMDLHDLYIPDGETSSEDYVGGEDSYLLLFRSKLGEYDHVYLRHNVHVAVFHQTRDSV